MFSLLHPSDINDIHCGAFGDLVDLFDLSDWWLNNFIESKYALDVDELLSKEKLDEAQAVMEAEYMLLFVRIHTEAEFEYLLADRAYQRHGVHQKRRTFYINQSMHFGVVINNKNNTVVGELNTMKPEGYQPCKIKKLA